MPTYQDSTGKTFKTRGEAAASNTSMGTNPSMNSPQTPPVGGGGSGNRPAYNAATGATTGTPSVEYNNYLKSLNRVGSSNYVDPGDGLSSTPLNTATPPITPSITPQANTAPTVPITTPTTTPTPIPASRTGAGLPSGKTAMFNGVEYNTNAQGQPVGVPIDQKYKSALSLAQASGQAPTTGNGAEVTAPFITPPEPDMTEMNNVLAQDPGYQQLMKMQKDYNDVINQKTSLVEEYQNMIQDSGIEQINTDLINTKNIIDGTEDDIRTEITKAGGFATDSQVLAMSNARNKTLIKNYNNLLDTKQMIMENVNTMIGLAEKDRANAMSALNTKMNIDTQIIEYADKMKTNAVNSYQKIIDSVGYAGLQTMAKGDPYYTSLIEKTLGLGTGGLAKLAGAPLSLKDQLLTEQIKTEQAQRAKIYSDMGTTDTGKIVKINGVDYLQNPDGSFTTPEVPTGTTPVQNLAYAKSTIDSVDSLKTMPGMQGAVGPTWLFGRAKTPVGAGARQNFIATVEQLTSQLSLESLISAKSRGATFGALSDSEMRILSATASKIGTWANRDSDGKVKNYKTTEANFKKELDKISNFAKLDYVLKGGNPEEVGVQVMPDDTYWTTNSDGSMTQIQ